MSGSAVPDSVIRLIESVPGGAVWVAESMISKDFGRLIAECC